MTSPAQSSNHLVHDWLAPVLAGFLAVLISCTGPLLLVIQAAHLAHLPEPQLASWIGAICLGSGICGLYMSWRLRTPIICAWNTPGAALLITSLALFPWAQAVGAFVFAGALVWLTGLSGWFEKLARAFPRSLCGALLAGILLRFGFDGIKALQADAAMVVPVLLVYLIMRRYKPRYAVALALAAGVLAWLVSAQFAGSAAMHIFNAPWQLTQPVWTTPEWNVQALISLSLPLAVLNLTGQQLPGVAILRAAGYAPHASRTVAATGLWSVLLAPFGSHGINLAAITAALCTGPDAHTDPAQRWKAGVACGVFYIVFALLAATFTALLLALPPSLVAAVAAVALLGAIGQGLTSAFEVEAEREAALITLITTASGVSLLGLGAGFWGLVIGGLAYAVLRKK